MGGCSILSCKSRSERKCAGITFHSFPPDINIRKKWIQSTGRRNWQPTKYSKICSLHFDKSCFIRTSKKIELKATAVPRKYDECFSGQDSTSSDSRSTKSQETSGKIKSENAEMDNDNIISPNKKICTDEDFSGQALAIKSENAEIDNDNISPNKKICTDQDFYGPASASHRCQVTENQATSNKTKSGNEVTVNENVSPYKKICMDPSTSQDPKYLQPEHIVTELVNKEIQKKFDKQKQISANRLKKLKTVQQSNRRLIKKIALLENIVTELKCKK